MTSGRLILIGLGIYVFALIATLPATFADSALRRASNGRVRLVETSGTLWSGDGQIEFRNVNGGSGVSKAISWRCLPQSLIGGHLVFDVELDQSPKRFPVTVSLSQIEVANADIRLPASILGLALPNLAPLGLGGDVSMHIAEIFLQRDGLRGHATLQWQAASSMLIPVSPLGDYELSFDGEGEMPAASLRTLQGPLQIDGKESATASGERMFTAIIQVPAQLQQQLIPLLRLITVQRSESVFEIQFK